MRGFLNILCFIFAALIGFNAIAYNTLPASRLLTFEDYDDSVWAHSGDAAPLGPIGMFFVKAGSIHEHSAGWYIYEARTGYTSTYVGGGRVVPPNYPGTPVLAGNYAANLRDVVGAYIESPYYADGIGTIYFDAVNSKSATSFRVLVATNMLYSGGGYADMRPNEDALHTYNWTSIDTINLNFSGPSDFGRYNFNLNYQGEIKLKIVRAQASGNNLDDEFLVIDNIQVSYPQPYVVLSEASSSVSPQPDFSAGDFSVKIKVDCFNSNQMDFNNIAITLWYRVALESGGTFGSWESSVLSYIAGTGDGNGVGREYEGGIPLAEKGAIEYYYVCGFDGHFVAQDYTETGINYPYPSESLSPMDLYADGMNGSDYFGKTWSFGAHPPITDLPASRILTFEDYADPVWTHSGDVAPIGPIGMFFVKPGSIHEHSAGWYIYEARTGYTSTHVVEGKVVPPNNKGTPVLAGNYAANLRNVVGAYIESPYYDDGVGTLYFEAVNSKSAVDLHVYMATDMFDTNIWMNVPMAPQEGDGKTYNWTRLEEISLDYTTQGDFKRYHRTINHRNPVKIKLVRATGTIGSGEIDDEFLVVDNIRISPPPTEVVISKSEVVNNPGYPNADNEFTVRCTVGNMDLNVPTEMRSVYLVHRWRYLDQRVDAWQTNQMNYVNGSGDANEDGEIYEVVVPAIGQEGDLEYYYTCFFGGYVYESPDYTETGFQYPYPTEDLSPKDLRATIPGAGEFSIRLRPYNSKYGAVYLVTDQHVDPIAMDLVDHHAWRGLVPLAGIAPTNLTWAFMAEKEHINGSTSFETNLLYWTTATSQGNRVPTLPYGGVGTTTNQSGRIVVSVNDSGYMEVNFNTETLEFLANRAEYQNFNAWPAREDFFSESSGQSDKKSFENNFDQWVANEDKIFIEPFTGLNLNTNTYVRDPFRTPTDWVSGSSKYVIERIFDTVYNPAGQTYLNFRNRALRLKGGDPMLGLGYAYNTIESLPDGLKTLKLKARIGQESDNYDIAYSVNHFTEYNYVFTANVGIGSGSPQEPTVSVVGYYTSPGSFYEFRVTQITDTRDNINSISDKQLKLEIIKWQNGVEKLLLSKTVSDTIATSSRSIRIGFYNKTATEVIIRGQLSSAALSVTDKSSPITGGTFGVLCSECEAGFSSFAKGGAGTDGAPTGTQGAVLAPAGWYMPLGVFTYRTDKAPHGIYKKIPNQQLNIYVQPTDYDSNQEPAALGATSWRLHAQKTVSSFGYNDITVDFKSWQSMFVLLQVGEGGNDIAVDELEVSSWHGKEIGLGRVDQNEWLATEAWVVSNVLGNVDHVLRLDQTRANPNYPDFTQGVRSLRLDNGTGMMEFDYRVVTSPAKLTVQYANPRNLNDWYDVESFVVTNANWTHASAYLGTNAPGFLRVINDNRSFGYSNAVVELDKVIVWDEPFVDDNSWKSYNTKVTSTDPMRLLLDASKGCYLNNDVDDETNPSPLNRDLPNLQSPVLIKGLGKISLQARAYDVGAPATIYVYASTNGWSLPREHWILIHQFDNIDYQYYKPYSYKPVDGSKYDAIRLETSLDVGANRACIEEVVISEPVYPGFDIVDVNLLLMERDGDFGDRKQPLAFEDVHVEARIINQQLAPSNIVMYIDYYVGDDPWGVGNWGSAVVTRRMHEVSGEPGLYRTLNDEGDVQGLPVSQIGGILGQADGDVVQYRVWASYLGGIPLFEYQEEFINPAWYYPVDLNVEKVAKGWSPYYIVYGVPPGTVWINEINLSDLIFGDGFVTQHGIWGNAYIEIATPAWLDLAGWKIDLVTQGDYVTHSITIPSGLPSLNAVTNGYAFFVISDSNPPLGTPAISFDFGYAGLRWNMPASVPGGVRLRRPAGMYEHAVAYDDAKRNMNGPYYDGKVWAAEDPEGRFVYVGAEQNKGSLSKVGAGNTTNDWAYPLFPQWEQGDPNFHKNYTPGMPNGLQWTPDADDLFPGVSNVMIKSSMSQLRGSQNEKRVLNYSLRMRIGASTNVTYDIDDWYRLVSLTSNGVEQLPPSSQFKEYTYDFNPISADVDLFAKINLREDLTGYRGNSTVINWILSYPEAPLVPMFYNDRTLNLTEQYWLDANPTTENQFYCVIRDFMFDGATNLHVRLEMKLNGNNLTNIQGQAVLKLQAKSSLMQSEWDMIKQFYLTKDSFNANNECRVVVSNPYEFILTTYDTKRCFLRWVIELEDPRVRVYELENTLP